MDVVMLSYSLVSELFDKFRRFSHFCVRKCMYGGSVLRMPF